ncbi:unnamed protein product, partial [Oppiella nova]
MKFACSIKLRGVYAVGLKCVTDISPDFDITKVENLEFGIENLEKRCCTLHVLYDCFIENGKEQCPADGDEKYSDLETILNNAKNVLDDDTCKDHTYLADQKTCSGASGLIH